MRIADRMLFDQTTSNLQKNRSEMSDLQNQAATLKRVTKPSDDPLAATRVLSFRTEAKANEQFLRTASQAKAILDYTDQSLGELTNLLIRAKELALSQASDASGNENSRRVVAEEVEQLFHQSIQVGNRKLGDRYIFGGYRTTASPFDANGNYQGDDGEVRMPINKETWLAVNIPGSEIFLGKQKLDHEIGDTSIVEPKDVEGLIKAEAHEISLKQQKAQNQQQQQGQQSNPAVRGPASIPGTNLGDKIEGESAANSQSNSLTGKGLNVATIKGTNVFDILNKAHISMKANDKAGIQDAIDDIDEAMSQVIMSRAKIGARMNTLDANVDSLRKLNIDAKEVASQLEDADQFEVVSNITKAEGTLQATLQTSSKLIQPSLLDFLR